MPTPVRFRLGALGCAIGLLALVGVRVGADEASGPAKPSAEAVRFFEAKIRPILAERCFQCHGPTKQKGGLRLDSRAEVLAGGDQGPAIVPGHPEKSLLLKAISHTDEALKMPPSKKLPAEQVADLTRWVKLGAPWPGTDPAGAKAAGAGVETPSGPGPCR